MSTFLETEPVIKRIRSIQDLYGYFQKYAKPASRAKIGIECEIFGVFKDTGKPLPYFGKVGIEQVLRELAYEFGYEPILDESHIIALQKNGTVISLEPGGQVELSAAPTDSLHDVKMQLDEFFFQLKTIAHFVGPITWIASGIHPFASLEEIDWVPKRRYRIMAQYLGTKGAKAHDMMKRTATNQLNLDYFSEKDAIGKMRLALAVTPIAAAMFANSSISKGKVTGFLSERLNIWRHTAPERCGLILDLICQHCSFEDYLNYVLDVPVMFFVRARRWIVTQNLTFRKFIEHGWKGYFPTETDFELHLSTIFTDARFKQYLEIRGMDGQRRHLIPSVYAFWKGILYDEQAEAAANQLIRCFREREVKKLHQDVERLGLRSKIHGHRGLELARELVQISQKGLHRQELLNSKGEDEAAYLEPLKEEILRVGKTPAEQTVELWNGPFQRDRRSLVDYLSV